MNKSDLIKSILKSNSKYDKLGNSVWRYTHKGGALYTNTWQNGVQKALNGIK